MAANRLRVLAGGIAASAALLAIPTGASGAVTLGENFNSDFCAGDTTYIQTDWTYKEGSGRTYEVPSPGVITRWSFRAGPNPSAQMKFKVGQRTVGNSITIVGESDLETIVPNSLNTFPTRIPVQAGDLIGHYLSASGECSAQNDLFTDLYFNDEVFPGETEIFTEENFQLNISARLEPYRCGGRDATLGGTAGKDRLVGTPGNDVIVGLDGKDKIKGKGGKDRICGGKGKDSLKGGGANDILKGAKGNDKLNGGGARDTCVGGPGDDTAKKCEVEKSI